MAYLGLACSSGLFESVCEVSSSLGVLITETSNDSTRTVKFQSLRLSSDKLVEDLGRSRLCKLARGDLLVKEMDVFRVRVVGICSSCIYKCLKHM